MKTTHLLYALSSYCLFVTVQTFFAPSSQLQQKTQNTILHQTKPSLIRLAAKKAKFSFSEDFLSALNDDDDEDKGKTKTSVNKTKPQKPSITPPSSSSSPESSDKTQNTDEKTLKSSKSKKKDKNKQRELWEDSSDVSEVSSSEMAGTATTPSSQGEAVSSEEVKEKEQRRSRLSSKIRLTERSQPSFLVMGLRGVEMTFGDETVLKNASFTVSTGERVGLVGPNGGGKSTQLRILYGELTPNQGEVIKSPNNIRVSFLRQEFIDELDLTRTLKEELTSACIEEQRVLQDIAQCEKDIEASVDDPEKMDDAINRLQELQDTATAIGAYSVDSKIQKIMDSMGFSPDEEDHLVGSFSGGWKMRIGLAKILCSDPNVLLLDEPTNHMDFDSVLWLEDFLKKQNIPMIIVSHDREFLDQVCNKIVDVEDGKTVSYTGNYSKFLQQRRERLTAWRERYDKQQRYVQEEEKWLRKARNDPVIALTSQVKQREAQLAKYKASPDYLPPPPKDRKFRFRFPAAPRCGDLVLEAQGLTHGFGTGKYAVLFKDVDYEVRKGNRIGFVGPNGSGKSTMLKIIMGMETPQKGYAEVGSGSVQINYYAQNQADSLNLDHTILEAVQEAAAPDVTQTEIRGLLGQFLFKNDDVFKKIRMLSGGEKARVALCRMMLQPANLLLLDEPTNHLDITSKEVLEDALLNYGGSVLIVSHDRYFMSQVVNTIFEFGDKTVKRYDCDYHDYLEHLSNPNSESDDSSSEGVVAPVVRGSTEDDVDGFLRQQERSKQAADRASREDSGDVQENSSTVSSPSLKDRMVARYVEGDKYKITKAKEVVVEEKNERSKNFGGSGVTSGNLYKGIKNAKRYTL